MGSIGISMQKYTDLHSALVLTSLDLYVTKDDISWTFSVVWFSKRDGRWLKIRNSLTLNMKHSVLDLIYQFVFSEQGYFSNEINLF